MSHQKTCPHCNGTGKVTDWTAFGGELQALRRSTGLTLVQVAGAMKISVGYLSDMEHGRKPWTLTKIEHFRHAIGLAA